MNIDIALKQVWEEETCGRDKATIVNLLGH